MDVLVGNNWSEYELLDSGDGKRLERFGPYILSRPDPQALWKPHLPIQDWQKADAVFGMDSHGKEYWIKRPPEEKWKMQYKDISFYAKLTPFKHTGVFPEQSVHWEWMENILEPVKTSVKVLNLFSYTGIASLVAASKGAEVTNVDASRPTLDWAKENQLVSSLGNKKIRYIYDDALAFCKREIRRGNVYEGIIVDPPVFGHGPKGEVWKFNEHFPTLLETCINLLSSSPLFLIVNAYAISASALMLKNMVDDYKKGTREFGELALQEQDSDRLLSTGIFTRYRF